MFSLTSISWSTCRILCLCVCVWGGSANFYNGFFICILLSHIYLFLLIWICKVVPFLSFSYCTWAALFTPSICSAIVWVNSTCFSGRREEFNCGCTQLKLEDLWLCVLGFIGCAVLNSVHLLSFAFITLRNIIELWIIPSNDHQALDSLLPLKQVI